MNQDGYPAEYLNRAKRDSRRLVTVVIAFGVVTLCSVYGAVFLTWPLQPAAVAVGLFLFLLCALYSSSRSPIQLALYFEKVVPGAFTWSAALARNCNSLDQVALDQGAAPLSSFGFADDLRREALVWHGAEEGLETVRTILASLRGEPELLDESEAMIADLEKWETRLSEAHKGETRFCVIFHGGAVNGMEVEQRKGYF